MDDKNLLIGEQVINWLTTELEHDFTESQASAITVAILYGIVFKDHLKEFFDSHINEILEEAKRTEEGEAPVD